MAQLSVRWFLVVGTVAFILIRQWQAHKLRAVLTLLGITIGVSVYFAMRTANAALLDSFNNTVVKLGGKSTLQITASESAFPEETLDQVRSVPGVEAAEPIIEVIGNTPLDSGGNLLIIGVDSTSDQKLHEYEFDKAQVHIDNPLEFILSPDSVAISESFAAAHDLKIGDQLAVFTSRGKEELTVRGTFKPSGLGEVFGGNIAIMDLHSAQLQFDRGTNLDRIDLSTTPGVDIETVQQRLRDTLAAGLEVRRPVSRGKNVESSVTAMSQGLLLSSLIALLVGTFIIFNFFSISVNQRWQEIGILRALGMERSNVLRMFLGEAALIGVFGSILGVGFGFVIASAANTTLMSIANSIYGLISAPRSPLFHPGYAIEAVILGIGASIVAAALPARAAAGLNPALALHNVESLQADSILKLARLPLGAAVVAIGTGLIRFTAPQVGTILQFGYAILILLGFIMMLPKLSEWIGRALRPITDRLFGSEGTLAVESMIQAPLRTSATVGALMMGLAFVFSTHSFIRSEKATFTRTMNNELTADLYVAASDLARSRTYHFSEELGNTLAILPGVKQIERLRWASLSYHGQDVAVMSIETLSLFARAPEIIIGGDQDRVANLMAKGDGVLVSRNFTTRWHINPGSDLRLETPNGPLIRPILAMIEDYTSEKGAVFMDRSLYKEYWRDSSVDFFELNLEPGASRTQVAAEARRALAGNYRAFVYTNAEYKQKIMNLLNRFFLLNYAQMAIAIFVGALGIINTLIISVSERKREIGVIRAVGALRSQIRKMVLIEAAALTIAGIVIGLLKSLFDTYFLVHTAAAIFIGDSLPFMFPGGVVLVAIPLVLAVALASAWFPAKRAAGLNVIEAIGYE